MRIDGATSTPVAITACVCGGPPIVAFGITGQALGKAIRRHAATPRHREWRRLGGLDFDPEALGRVVA